MAAITTVSPIYISVAEGRPLEGASMHRIRLQFEVGNIFDNFVQSEFPKQLETWQKYMGYYSISSSTNGHIDLYAPSHEKIAKKTIEEDIGRALESWREAEQTKEKGLGWVLDEAFPGAKWHSVPLNAPDLSIDTSKLTKV